MGLSEIRKINKQQNPQIKSFFVKKVPNIAVLCFQCLPEFPVKQVLVFLASPPSQDLNLRAGLEDNVSQRYQAALKFWHRGIVMETSLCTQQLFLPWVFFFYHETPQSIIQIDFWQTLVFQRSPN